MRHVDLRIWLYRRLRVLAPGWGGRRVVRWLLVKAERLTRRGLAAAAVASARDAVGEGARIAPSDPELCSYALAALAGGLLRQRRPDEAVRVVARMAALAAEAGAVDSAAGDRIMGWALLVRSPILQEQGQRDEALAAAVEGVRLFRTHMPRHARRCRPGLAAALSMLGHRYTDRDQHPEAVAAYREAVDLYWQLFNRRPARWSYTIMEVHAFLALALGTVGDFRGALRAAEFSTGFLRFLVRRGREAYRPMFAQLVNSSAVWHHERGDLGAAAKAAAEAVEQYRILAGQDEAAYRSLFAASHHNLITRRRAVGPAGDTMPVRRPVTLAGLFLRATMLRHEDERVRLHAEVKRTGSVDSDAFVQLAFKAAVRRYFVSGLEPLLVDGFVADVRDAFGPKTPAEAMDALIRRELGGDASTAGIDVVAEFGAYVCTLMAVADLLERDEADVDAILVEAEAAADERGLHPTKADQQPIAESPAQPRQ